MKKISAILLAAGQSRRMGEINKLLLPVKGKSFVRRTTEVLMKFKFHEVIVVTGHESDLVEKEIQDFQVKVVQNLDFETGMHSSIRAGVRQLKNEIDGFMICLSDQPFFHAGLVSKLADQFSELDQKAIVFPTLNGQRGHPVFISNIYRAEILTEQDGDFGCFYLFKRHPENLFAIELHDEAAVFDIDTPAQYKELRALR